MDRSLAFYRDLLGLELLWRRVFEEPEIREIVGVPEASAIEVAMLRVPGSDLDVELLEYKGWEPRSGATEPSRHGTGHFCMFVRSIDALFADLRVERSPLPLRSTGRDDRRAEQGRQEPHSLDPDGYTSSSISVRRRPPRDRPRADPPGEPAPARRPVPPDALIRVSRSVQRSSSSRA